MSIITQMITPEEEAITKNFVAHETLNEIPYMVLCKMKTILIIVQ